MNLNPSVEPAKAEVGQEVTLYMGSKPYELEVAPACEINEDNSGHWACGTHGPDDHQNTFGALDWRKDCLAVWICHEHGPEAP